MKLIVRQTGTIFDFCESTNGTDYDGIIYGGNSVKLAYTNDTLTVSVDGGGNKQYPTSDLNYDDGNEIIGFTMMLKFVTALKTAGFTGNFNGAGATAQYSTTETVVGTWIDGKPIYCKVVVLPAGSLFVNTSNQVVNIPNLKRLLPTSNYSFYRNFGSDEILTNPFYTAYSGGTPATFSNVDYISLSQIGSDIKLKVFGLYTSAGTYESTFILFYTKTTD